MTTETELKPEREVDCPHCKGSGKMTVPADVTAIEAFYFGCWRESGHHWHNPKNTYLPEREITAKLPEAVREYRIDGCFAPGAVFGDQFKKTKAEVEGEAALHHFEGWTLLSWWDRTIDHRSASNSSVIARGTHSFASMLEIIKAQMPNLIERRKGREIVMAEQWTLQQPKWRKT